MSTESFEEHCKKCGQKLSEEDYVFMGYCEKCYNEENNKSYGNEYDDEQDEKVLTSTNAVVSVISFVLGIITDAMVFLPELDFPILTIVMIYGLVWAYLSRYIGLKKNIYSGYVWGYFFGIIGFIIICALPGEKSTQQYDHSSADEIKKYKELLDMGAITQDEFDSKKKELLNLKK